MLKSFPPNFTKTIGMGLLTSSLLILSGCDNANSSTTKNAKQSTTSVDTNTSTESSVSAVPTNNENNAKVQQLLQANLTKSGINTKVLSVTPTSMPNIYWVKAEGMPGLFTNSTGQYVIQGEIVKVGTAKPESISSDIEAREAKAALATIDKKDMIIFPAKGATKGVINVFTDVDCGYCRKLHSQINEINALGIEVRYLPWPRSEESFPIMESVWCSKDRNSALTKAKMGEPVDAPACNSPVKRIHDLGLNLGITGTPAIFTQDGKQIGGYLPPDELAHALNIQ